MLETSHFGKYVVSSIRCHSSMVKQCVKYVLVCNGDGITKGSRPGAVG